MLKVYSLTPIARLVSEKSGPVDLLSRGSIAECVCRYPVVEHDIANNKSVKRAPGPSILV